MYQTIDYLKEVAELKINNGEKPYKEIELLFEIYICSCNQLALQVKDYLEGLMK